MPTPAERKALLFFSAVLVLGASTRAYRTLHSRSPADARAQSALDRQIKAADSARRAGLRKPKRERKQKAPPATGRTGRHGCRRCGGNRGSQARRSGSRQAHRRRPGFARSVRLYGRTSTRKRHRTFYGSEARLSGNLLARSASYKQSHIQAIRAAKSTRKASS